MSRSQFSSFGHRTAIQRQYGGQASLKEQFKIGQQCRIVVLQRLDASLQSSQFAGDQCHVRLTDASHNDRTLRFDPFHNEDERRSVQVQSHDQ